MSATLPDTEPKNLILRHLPPAITRKVLAVAEAVHLDLREPVMSPNEPISFVDFPESGIISLLTAMDDGTLVELASIGREGMFGIPVVLGIPDVDAVAFCQVPGMTWRVPAAEFVKLLAEHTELATLCDRYIMMMFEQVGLNTGCNRTHSTEQRCARWLLLTQDRCDADELILTQEFLASMLGVSRTGVNAAAGKLAEEGLIRYVRGKVRITDRAALEKVSCLCYKKMRNASQRVFEQVSV